MDKLYAKARRMSGEARYERTQTRKTRGIWGRMQLAHNVPGTPEHGRLAMYHAQTERIVERLREESKEG